MPQGGGIRAGIKVILKRGFDSGGGGLGWYNLKYCPKVRCFWVVCIVILIL